MSADVSDDDPEVTLEEAPAKSGGRRRCVAARSSFDRKGLIRFVVGPDGAVLPDVAEKLPGRGAWVAAERGALERAVKRGIFARAFKQAVTTPDDLPDQVAALLMRRFIEAVGVARKAGLAVSGFDTVQATLKERVPPALLLEARDGAEGGRARLRSVATAREIPVAAALTGDELGVAFARESVIHAALKSGGAAKRAIREARRLEGVRGPA